MSRLVLTRCVGQRVWLNDNVSVEVVMVGLGRARLLFTAPKGVPVMREELLSKDTLDAYKARSME